MAQDIILVVDGISQKTRELAQQALGVHAEVVIGDWNPDSIDSVNAKARILVTSTKGIPPEMLSRAQKCIFIQKLGAGVNNIDIEQANRRKIPVANTPATNALSVAEYTLAMILAVYKQIVRGHNGLVQDGKWLKTVLRDNNFELSGKTVGLVGFGAIGKRLRKLLTGFDCNVLYTDAFRLPEETEKELAVTFLPLEELLQASDVVSLHCPLTEETHHLINARRLALMKPGAVLVNCARGGIVDESALFETLKSGRLLGAAIDTYEKEPIDNTHPFCSLPNIVVGPHNGGGTVEAISAVMSRAAANINSLLTTGKLAHPEYVVNRAEIGL
jgi:D-3-phosphoglycerate dehydrogenase